MLKYTFDIEVIDHGTGKFVRMEKIGLNDKTEGVWDPISAEYEILNDLQQECDPDEDYDYIFTLIS